MIEKMLGLFHISLLSLSVVLSSSLHGYRQRQLDDLGFDLLSAKTSAQEVLSLIYNRYEMFDTYGPEFFYTTANIGESTWNMIKYKIALKALQGSSSYLMIFGGSSVTAGHDNYYIDSFPMIVQKRMKGVFDKLNIDLIVRNIAQGANACTPYNLCTESMGGLDPDFVGWEQSFNCGHDSPIFELMSRIAYQSKNKAIVYYSASGAFSPTNCPNTTETVPYSDEKWTPTIGGLKNWSPSISDIQHIKNKMNQYNTVKSSASRFVTDSKYKHWSFGFNVWDTNDLCTVTVDKTVTKKGCNGYEAINGCSMKFMSKEASLYSSEVGAKWHPPRAIHLLRGEAIVWVYLLSILEGIYMIEQDYINSKISKQNLIEKYEKQLNTYYEEYSLDNHPPKHCVNQHCEKRPVCYTDYRPHYTSLSLTNSIIGSTQWTTTGTYGDWSRKYGYLDLKPAYSAPVDMVGQELHLRVQIKEKNVIWLCGALHHIILHLDINYPFKTPIISDLSMIDGRYTEATDSIETTEQYRQEHLIHTYPFEEYKPTKKRKFWPHKKYLGNDCKAVYDLPPGDHVLSLSTNSSHPEHVSTLSHMITWA